MWLKATLKTGSLCGWCVNCGPKWRRVAAAFPTPCRAPLPVYTEIPYSQPCFTLGNLVVTELHYEYKRRKVALSSTWELHFAHWEGWEKRGLVVKTLNWDKEIWGQFFWWKFPMRPCLPIYKSGPVSYLCPQCLAEWDMVRAFSLRIFLDSRFTLLLVQSEDTDLSSGKGLGIS